jgi:hypothetical protein
LARYFQLSSKEDNSNSNEGNTDPPSSNSNGNLDPPNSNGNVDHSFDVDQLDLGNVDATRSVIIEQSRILAQLR